MSSCSVALLPFTQTRAAYRLQLSDWCVDASSQHNFLDRWSAYEYYEFGVPSLGSL
jgi:hypothetical protein